MLRVFHTAGLVEAGCDEAGRGCLAGPVFAAAVVLPQDFSCEELNDSKQLTERQRYALREVIERDALRWAVAECSPAEIDRMNILRCSILAMQRALDQIGDGVEHILVDGNRWAPYHALRADGSRADQPTPADTVVKGDATYMSIAAASVLAKTYRDDRMKQLAHDFPHYGWDKNMGYPSKAHREAIRQYGPTPHHRMTFRLLPEEQLLLDF